MKTFIAIVLVFVGIVAGMLCFVSKMPGASPPGGATLLNEEEKSCAERMNQFCEQLAHVIGHRSTAKPLNIVAAREVIVRRLGTMALKSKETPISIRGTMGANVEAEIEGGSLRNEVVVLGAHYDSNAYDPGADDNASGCAMLLELAGYLKNQPHDRTIKIVFFDFGSSRFAGSKDSGAGMWADNASKTGMKIVAMISLDSVGKFKNEGGTQSAPFPLSLCYPSVGNFLLVAGDLRSRDLVKSSVAAIRSAGMFPAEGLTVPSFLPWFDCSDHVAFREKGWPAIAITDTGPYRNKEHGTPDDGPDRLQYDRMAKATMAVLKVVERLARGGGSGAT